MALKSSGLSDIVALADLISSSVKDVVAEYTAAQVTMPSLVSTRAGAFDMRESMPANLVKAVRTIEAACAQLSYTVASPEHVICQRSFAIHEQVSLLVATDANIADHLRDKPEGLHVDELSRSTGIDSHKLGRVLRLLATKHCFTEVKPDVFANNRLSVKLLSTDPVSSVVGHMTDEIGFACTALNETLRNPKTTSSVSTRDSAFTRAHGRSIFDLYARPDQKKLADRFGQAMVGWGQISGRGMLSKVYPWGSLPHDTVLCDVGGNNGHASIEVLRVFPHLKIVVNDLPDVVKRGQEDMLKGDLDPALKERVQFVSLDFFSGTPVQDCDVYYIRQVLHDWPVDECNKILEGIRSAAKPTSRLLIRAFLVVSVLHLSIPFLDEVVLQHLVDDGSGLGFERAPEPLLPNFGAGNFWPYAQDINMMVRFIVSRPAANEYGISPARWPLTVRNAHCPSSSTSGEFKNVSHAIFLTRVNRLSMRSGFKFVKLWDVGETTLLEFVLSSVD
ncbi:3-O-methyltransferase 2 [Mycena sanguinolenta]|uniref:3-O-methyltransferase 2 n=1 Tax=Mycena sanguinolenta TaxID=230812 RepID=A0A8H6ZE55_9AGAR|nr:3-O-methyltransferase 2 [Mycena sanguinolenta]